MSAKILPDVLTTHSDLPVVLRRCRSAVLQSMFSLLERVSYRLEQDLGCMVGYQKPPIQKHPRPHECDWHCAGERCHEEHCEH
ncbi:hypothetical protein AVEN_255702-1 [Araneus ventricosus]|uniref:Uncharacterized protein n=1 Tax=Araneus ventricosus TaxID=182803 RepID=A0A4Y2MDL8_ARAVE|nr:hypothetical protein AVEN_255702-1 [Araneus ventricosus]